MSSFSSLLQLFLKIVASRGEVDSTTYAVLLKNLLAAGNWRKYTEVIMSSNLLNFSAVCKMTWHLTQIPRFCLLFISLSLLHWMLLNRIQTEDPFRLHNVSTEYPFSTMLSCTLVACDHPIELFLVLTRIITGTQFDAGDAVDGGRRSSTFCSNVQGFIIFCSNK